jgi:hypothetical protein
MSKPLDCQSATQVLATAPGIGILFAYGTTVPTDNAAGYAPGCLFLDIDSTTINTVVYSNIGTAAACNFDPLKG